MTSPTVTEMYDSILEACKAENVQVNLDAVNAIETVVATRTSGMIFACTRLEGTFVRKYPAPGFEVDGFTIYIHIPAPGILPANMTHYYEMKYMLRGEEIVNQRYSELSAAKETDGDGIDEPWRRQLTVVDVVSEIKELIVDASWLSDICRNEY
jgi:hypothetical protein